MRETNPDYLALWEDRNARAAGPLLLFFGGWAGSIVIGALTGTPTGGFVAGPLIGYGATEMIYAAGPQVYDRIARALTRRPRIDERAPIGTMYREQEQRRPERAQVDETPRRVDLSAEYRPPEYEPLRPKQHRPPTWAESENAIILD